MTDQVDMFDTVRFSGWPRDCSGMLPPLLVDADSPSPTVSAFAAALVRRYGALRAAPGGRNSDNVDDVLRGFEEERRP